MELFFLAFLQSLLNQGLFFDTCTFFVTPNIFLPEFINNLHISFATLEISALQMLQILLNSFRSLSILFNINTVTKIVSFVHAPSFHT